jgi:hypothetical protein
MSSQKQVLANQQNALKSTGPKTNEGKAVAARNSLKHGLLAKEAVITEGEGAEDQAAFDALVSDILTQYQPVGLIEEMLAEKVVVAYWRLRRANRYEVGTIRKDLDTAEEEYYDRRGISADRKLNQTDVEIDENINKNNSKQIPLWQANKKEINKAYKSGKDLESIYDLDVNWVYIPYWFEGIENINSKDPEVIREKLNKAGVTDDQIWQVHIESCQNRIDSYQQDNEKLKKDKVKNRLILQVKKKLASLPAEAEMKKLLRYETAIENQLYKAINKLEHLQRLRAGDNVPAPLQVDLNVSA